MQHEVEAASFVERKLAELGLKLPPPPEPFGAYAEAVEVGNLLWISGMLPTAGRNATYVGRFGAELDMEAVRNATIVAALNGLAVAKHQLTTLDRIFRVVRLGVAIATYGDIRNHPVVADAASELIEKIFGAVKNPCRLVYGVASLPLGCPVELELIVEIRK